MRVLVNKGVMITNAKKIILQPGYLGAKHDGKICSDVDEKRWSKGGGDR